MLSPGSFSDESIASIDSSGVPWLFIAAREERFLQEITGYHSTICSGRVIYRHGKATGKLPGRLIRGPQAPPLPSVRETMSK